MSFTSSSDDSSNYPRNFQVERSETTVADILHNEEPAPVPEAPENNEVEVLKRQEELDMESKAKKNGIMILAVASFTGYYAVKGSGLMRSLKGGIFGLVSGGLAYCAVKLHQETNNLSPQEKALMKRAPGFFEKGAALADLAAGLGNQRACSNAMKNLIAQGLIKRQGNGTRDATYQKTLLATLYW